MPFVDSVLEARVALESRDAQAVLTPNETQRTTLIVCGCYIVAIGILWYVLASTPFSISLNPRDTRHVPYLKTICEHAELVQNRLVFINASPKTQYTPSSSSRSPCTKFVTLGSCYLPPSLT